MSKQVNQSTDLSDGVHGADGVQGAELWPVGDFDLVQQELAPSVASVFTYDPTAKTSDG